VLCSINPLYKFSEIHDPVRRLILSQFRWLNFLVDSKSLTEKLLEVLTICPLALKKEIISFLPEVIVDADHEMVMQALEQMLQVTLLLSTIIMSLSPVFLASSAI